MDWANENFVKVFTRETEDDLLLSWQARAVWKEMLTKFDRAGVIQLKRGRTGLAALVRYPLEVIDLAIPELVADGRVRELPTGYFAPNFMEAQEATASDAQRKRESREKRRARAAASADAASDEPEVASGDPESADVLSGDPPDRSLLLASYSGLSGSSSSPSGADPRGDLVREAPQLELVPDPPPDLKLEKPGPTHTNSRADLRRRLFGEAWQFAGQTFFELKAAGVDPDARNSWSGTPSGSSHEVKALFARIDELLGGDPPNFEHVREVIRNRVLVAAAEARHKLGHLRFMTPACMWNEKSFSLAKDWTPAQVEAAARASPGARDKPAEPARKIPTL